MILLFFLKKIQQHYLQFATIKTDELVFNGRTDEYFKLHDVLIINKPQDHIYIFLISNLVDYKLSLLSLNP